MRINNNISSMVTQGSLSRINRDMSSSIQKLSTGLRINSAADDAAGLGVSETLRTQVRGMSQAKRNTQDAIALLNIADGALNEQADILQRMRELVIQAKNDTYTDTERQYMGQEFVALRDELDRIAATTTYNGMRLFAAPQEKYGTGVYTVSRPGLSPREVGDQSTIYGADNGELSVFGADDVSSSHHFNMMIGGNYTDADIDAYTGATRRSYNGASNMITIQLGQMDANGIFNKGSTAAHFAREVFNGFSFNADFTEPDFHLQDGIINFALGGNATIHDKLEMFLQVIDGDDIDPTIAGFFYGTTTSNFTGLERVNRMRGHIGAMINRLEHATNNLTNQVTNTQSAESLIRDVDFATEASKLTRAQILTQSATSMLAQSNMSAQSVLSLIQ